MPASAPPQSTRSDGASRAARYAQPISTTLSSTSRLSCPAVYAGSIDHAHDNVAQRKKVASATVSSQGGAGSAA
jgi:hypothetical protein